MGRRTLLLIASILIAAVGTALIGLYVRGADNRAQQTEGMVSALVATETRFDLAALRRPLLDLDAQLREYARRYPEVPAPPGNI